MAVSALSDLDRLIKFVCIGTENGVHHVHRPTSFSIESTASIDSILQSQEKSLKALEIIKHVFEHKEFNRKETMLYALARFIRSSSREGKEDAKVREKAYLLSLEVCETFEELFIFIDFNKRLHSENKSIGGRGMRDLIKHFYGRKSPMELVMEATRCKSGKGFTHRDVLKLVHMNALSKGEDMNAVVTYLLYGKRSIQKLEENQDSGVQEVLKFIKALESIKSCSNLEMEVVRSLIEQHSLRESQIPSWCSQHSEAFEGYIGHMSLDELIRSIPKMASLGMLDPHSVQSERIIARLKDEEALLNEKLSPVMVFSFMKKYELNREKKWLRNQELIDAFSDAYKASLKSVPSTGKRHLLAVHVNSKVTKLHVLGSAILSPIMPSAVMAQILAHSEQQFEIVFFHTVTTKLNITKDMNTVGVLEQILLAARDPTNEQSDLTQPFSWASSNHRLFDNILVVTDKKMVASNQALIDAISQYRSSCQEDAKVAIVGLSDCLQIPNSDDLNYLDISGFDETVPRLIQKFFEGNSTGSLME